MSDEQEPKRTAPSYERIEKYWWIIPDGGDIPQRHLGCTCVEGGHWWFEELGMTTDRVFATRREAMRRAVKECRDRVTRELVLMGKLFELI